MPIISNISSVLTLKVPGAEGKAPSISLLFFSDNIKTYVNLLNGQLSAGSSEQAAGLMVALKI